MTSKRDPEAELSASLDKSLASLPQPTPPAHLAEETRRRGQSIVTHEIAPASRARSFLAYAVVALVSVVYLALVLSRALGIRL